MPSRLLVAAATSLAVLACGSGFALEETASSTTVAVSSTPGPGTSLVTPTSRPAPHSTPTVPSVTAPSPTPTMGEGDRAVDAAAEDFLEWVGYLADGDHQAAWDAMAPTSQAAVGEEPFFDYLVYAMSEGWGSWSAAENIDFRLDQDENGRTLLWVGGTIRPEGMEEDREVAVPLVETPDGYLVSPFEEFGNVARGVEEELAGTESPPLPPDSGTGRRVVYSNSDQRVWMVEEDGSLADSYLVSGKQGVPAPGTYEVYSRSEVAFAGHDDITMRYMVRFAHGENLPIGFHSIPNDGNGAPLQSEEELGEYHSAGCVRQSLAHAVALYEWATEGTPVVVLP